MLVLSRHRDETVMIGDEIELTVVDIRGDKVRIGIKAPTRVPVHRKEVYEAIRRENDAAGRLDGGGFTNVRPEPPAPPERRSSSDGLRLVAGAAASTPARTKSA
ncbi:MAG: carbon storage regulator CsrA [Phycisphaerales bacterium]